MGRNKKNILNLPISVTNSFKNKSLHW